MEPLIFNMDVESQFWGFQFLEHVEFTFQLLDEQEFKSHAAQLLKSASGYSTEELAQALLELHSSIFDVQRTGESVGPLWPSLVSHMMDEQNWYLRLVSGNVSARDYACFTAKSASGAMGLTARLIDPISQDVSNVVLESSRKFARLEKACQTSYLSSLVSSLSNEIELSILGSESEKFHHALKVISPKMVAHENREHHWFTQHF